MIYAQVSSGGARPLHWSRCNSANGEVLCQWAGERLAWQSTPTFALARGLLGSLPRCALTYNAPHFSIILNAPYAVTASRY